MNKSKSLPFISSICRASGRDVKKEGFVLALTLVLVLVTSLVSSGLVFAARNSLKTLQAWTDYDNTLLAAQAAIEKEKSRLHANFLDLADDISTWNRINWIEENSNYQTNAVLGTLLADTETPPVISLSYENAVVDIVVTNKGKQTYPDGTHYIDIVVTTEATYQGIKRKIEETFTYTLVASGVFDHCYFMNNFGWMSGVNIAFNGDLRSNYDFSWGTSKGALNGESFAADENTRTNAPPAWNQADYIAKTSDEARPFYYVDNSTNEAAEFLPGYNLDNAGTLYEGVAKLDMPYIGNIETFIEYAEENGGTITYGTNIIEAVTATNSLYTVLTGTLADPIVIDGPVVIRGDLIINGYYTGQGTIYAERNVHILSHVVATNPPVWNHPDTVANFGTTLTNNISKDFLGLCAKGNVVFGSVCEDESLVSSRYWDVDPYEISPSDDNIFPGTYDANGKFIFDGDYRAVFGKREDGSDRGLHQPTMSSADFMALGPEKKMSHLDAFIYNNHLTVGQLGGEINGGIICRDENMIPVKGIFGNPVSGCKIDMNWDPRVSSKLDGEDYDFKPFLPKTLTTSKTINWREIAP